MKQVVQVLVAVLAFSALLRVCSAIIACPVPEAPAVSEPPVVSEAPAVSEEPGPEDCEEPDCGFLWAVWDEAEKRREALEGRARAAIGIERTMVLDALSEARVIEQAAYVIWRRDCYG